MISYRTSVIGAETRAGCANNGWALASKITAVGSERSINPPNGDRPLISFPSAVQNFATVGRYHTLASVPLIRNTTT